MTYDKLLDKIEDIEYWQEQYAGKTFMKALRAVVELHKPADSRGDLVCAQCPTHNYPCLTIQAIEKALS
jgi:hypothetical protein